MTKKFCVINQAGGIGDILWEQKIAHHYHDIGYHVIWPVDPPYDMIGDYIDSPWCEFVKIHEDDYPFKNVMHNAPHCLSQISMNMTSEIPIVESKMIDGFNVFDWVPIILDAKEVHTADTGICYLVEKYFTGQGLFMYERSPNIEYHIQGIFDRWNMVKFSGKPYEVSI